MNFNLWFVIVGTLLVLMALSETILRRLPLSTGILYLGAGIGLGGWGLGLIRFDPIESAAILERATEVVVIISLFSAGLKLRTPLDDGRWRIPVRLATLSMTLTVGLIALVGWGALGLPIGAAVLLGAVLAPTDPVLASDVQVEHAGDSDRLRFGLTGEAGLNDGTAFPFVMLGLGLLGLHPLGEWGWRWLAVDVLWAVVGGLAIGTALGMGVGRLVVYLRKTHKEAVGLDDFLALGLIALSYGLALLAVTYGFLAVFAAGLALRRIERQASGSDSPPADVAEAAEVAAVGGGEKAREVATAKETAPAYMAQAVLGFSEQLERMGTIAVVLLLGGTLAWRYLTLDAVWFVPLLLLVIRPLAVFLGLRGIHMQRRRTALIGWFGIRGIGSLYYLAYAIEHGLPEPLAERLIALTFSTVVASVAIHGITVTPLMAWYSRRTAPPAEQPAV